MIIDKLFVVKANEQNELNKLKRQNSDCYEFFNKI